MLVFLSDLHITNKTTGVQHLSAAAFEEALENIARQARQAQSKEITFVFLGDIFDLVRTTFWFDKPLRERPWGILDDATAAEKTAMEAHALALLNETVAKSQDIFDVWSQPMQDRFGLEPRRIYIPGNHDRICNQFPSLRQRVIDVLGLNYGLTTPLVSTEPFAYYFHDAKYQVFARHGQEWDDYNFEHAADWSDKKYIIPPNEHYLEIPIGEVIASEVASRLPTAVCQQLGDKVPEDDLKLIVEHMKTIDDVRPTAAIVPWLIDSVRTQKVMRKHENAVLTALTDASHQVITDFNALPFTQMWIKKHDSFLPWDYVDRLQAAIFALRHLDITQFNRILRMAETRPADALSAMVRLMPCAAQPDDNYATEAAKDLQRIAVQADLGPTLYVLYGHTHRADQVPMDMTKEAACQVYLNTGTWRPLYRQTMSQAGFMRWKNLTFTIFYAGDTDPASAAKGIEPTFETWTGTLLDPLHPDPQTLPRPC